jgi:hypothetical protein
VLQQLENVTTKLNGAEVEHKKVLTELKADLDAERMRDGDFKRLLQHLLWTKSQWYRIKLYFLTFLL